MITANPIQESDYPEIMHGKINNFWQKREEGFVLGKGQKNLYWVSVTSANHTKAIVVANGRVESAWKYQELLYHFFQLGYDVYSFDHRGQGLSDRLTEDRQIGHVDSFSHYVDDMAELVDGFKLGRYDQKFLIAHSMGGAISTRYLQCYPNHGFDRVALSAPMFGVNMSPLLKPIAPYWACLVSLISIKPDYLTKNREYRAKPFKLNPLTSSKVRYKWFRDLYEDMPQLKIGGPSAHWIWQALSGAAACIKNAKKLVIPTLLIQAERDDIVSNQAQLAFIASLSITNKASKLEISKGSKHEILFENDKIRDEALSMIHRFFEQD